MGVSIKESIVSLHKRDTSPTGFKSDNSSNIGFTLAQQSVWQIFDKLKDTSHIKQTLSFVLQLKLLSTSFST